MERVAGEWKAKLATEVQTITTSMEGKQKETVAKLKDGHESMMREEKSKCETMRTSLEGELSRVQDALEQVFCVCCLLLVLCVSSGREHHRFSNWNRPKAMRSRQHSLLKRKHFNS